MEGRIEVETKAATLNSILLANYLQVAMRDERRRGKYAIARSHRVACRHDMASLPL